MTALRPAGSPPTAIRSASSSSASTCCLLHALTVIDDVLGPVLPRRAGFDAPRAPVSC